MSVTVESVRDLEECWLCWSVVSGWCWLGSCSRANHQEKLPPSSARFRDEPK